jgi:hypothetical protein
MPYTLLDKLKINECLPLQLSIELFNRTIRCTNGFVKSVLLSANGIVVPTDFTPLENSPILLGRPFVATFQAMEQKSTN